MHHTVIKSSVTESFYGLIQQSRDVETGRKVLSEIAKHGLETEPFLATHLIRMFSSFGSLLESNQVFSKLLCPTAFAWSAIISAHSELGHSHHARLLYNRMWTQEEFTPNEYVFVHSLRACPIYATHVRLIHHHIVQTWIDPKVIVTNTLIDVYTKCGGLSDAQDIFKRVKRRDIVAWNAMLGGYTRNGYIEEGDWLFEEMRTEGVAPNHVTWNTLISGSCAEQALAYFEKMQNEGFSPNHGTFVGILQACRSMNEGLLRGMSVHIQILESNLRVDLTIGSTLIDMYVRCGDLERARQVFDSLPKQQDVVIWNNMISGYVEYGLGHLVFRLIHQMQEEMGMRPDQYTFVSAIQACTQMGSLEQGKQLHSLIIEDGFDADIYVGSSLIDMYCKWQGERDGRKVLETMPKHNSVMWNAMLAGYAQQSDYKRAIQLFESKDITPDEVTFISLLSACSHSGLLDEAFHHIKHMEISHGITPSVHHYDCLLDVMGRTGYLNEAIQLEKIMAFSPRASAARSLLSHCITHGNVELGKQCFVQGSALEVEDSARYILMSKLCADVGIQDDAIKFEEWRKSSGVLKKPGLAFIEVDNHVHHFIVGDVTKSGTRVLSSKLKRLKASMMQKGYMPICDLVMQFELVGTTDIRRDVIVSCGGSEDSL